MKVQRNPECMIVNCAPPLELVAKVRTAIAGRMVPWWTRAGHKPSKRKRQMGVSTFFIEAVAKAVEGVVPSRRTLRGRRRCRRRGAKTMPSPRVSAGRNAAQSDDRDRNGKSQNRKAPVYWAFFAYRRERREKGEADFSLSTFWTGGGRKIPKPDPLAPSGEINLRKRLILYHISGVTRF